MKASRKSRQIKLKIGKGRDVIFFTEISDLHLKNRHLHRTTEADLYLQM